MSELGADRTFLLDQQYRTADNLQARIALHERFSTNPRPFPEWVFDRLEFPAAAEILEVGCGNGNLWLANRDRIPRGWRLTLTDFSEGMLSEARRRLGGRAAFRVADAQELPFADESFDAVIANHMLFHVADRGRALAEIRRVLRPGGSLVATTNGRGHLRELRWLVDEPEDDAWFERFGLENGAEQLEHFFADVEAERFPDSLKITQRDPLVAYVQSLGDRVRDLDQIAVRTDAAIAQEGAWHVTKSVGLFRCRKR